MNCRAGAGAGAAGASGKWQRQFCLHWPHIVPASRQRYLLYLWVPLICTFARLRLPLPFAVDFRRFPTNDCPFFLGGQQDNRTRGHRRQRRICFYYFRRAESVCCFVRLQLPQSPGQVSFFVLLREFITFRVLRLLSGSSALSPLFRCSAQLSSLLFCCCSFNI